MSRFLIVGAGRSGTTYAQAVHQVCGIPTSHQKVFTWASVAAGEWDWGTNVGEASFMAVPALPLIRHKEPDTRIVLIKRDIDAIAESWAARGAFQPDMGDTYPDWHDTITRMFPSVFSGETPVEQAKRYAMAWQIYAAAYADAVFDIESLSLPALFAATGQAAHYDEVLAGSISTTINSGPP